MAIAPTGLHPDPAPNAQDSEKLSTRGRLKVFLGAAPGVGKTYAMLEAGAFSKSEGVDVVIGIVETHGRHEAAILMDGGEAVARRSFTYGGHTYEELDVEAVLRRKPQLVLVDEFAHANAVGSRHPKRFQDIEELLDAGIDVYTTLNIQHLDSLNDVVSQITHVQVRDTIPDSVLQEADKIELVDLPPEELLQRLRQGKVHVGEDARHTMSQFFTPGNLTALRELALRYVAERVDQQMLHYRQANAISGIWPTRERIIVCISEIPAVSRLIRIAKRSAERRKVPWIALYVETHQHQALKPAARDRIHEALRLADQLGGEAVTIVGETVIDEILDYAKSRNATQIIVGKSRRPRWVAAFFPSITDKLLNRTDTMDILVITSDKEDHPLESNVQNTRLRPPVPLKDYVAAFISMVIATLVAITMGELLPFRNYALLYLTAIILIAIRRGRNPALLAVLLSIPLYNYFFIEPRYSFAFDKIDPITLSFFLIAALSISNLASRVRAQVEATRLSERRSKNLYDFNRKVAGAVSLDDVLWAVVHHVASTVNGRALVLMPKDGTLEIVAGYPPETFIDETSTSAAEWAWRQGKAAGHGSNTLPTAEWLFLPLGTVRGVLGVLGVQIENKARLPSAEETRLLDSLVDQAAVAIERTNLASDYEETRILMETEKLRSALLSSISHDLRTPLVSIIGSVTSLIDFGKTLVEDTKLELLETIREEAERLNRFVQNLLDMTRLGSGALKPKREWVEISDVIGAALERLKRQLGERKVEVKIEPALPMLSLDFVLIEQVLINIIDNACKYSPPGSYIHVAAKREGDMAAISVCDEGPGIPKAEREQVFDMFYRVKATDKQIAGTGLGLAICRGIIEAHGGTIDVTNTESGRGVCIEFKLPIQAAPILKERDTPTAELMER